MKEHAYKDAGPYNQMHLSKYHASSAEVTKDTSLNAIHEALKQNKQAARMVKAQNSA